MQGGVWCWGLNLNGVLGNGSSDAVAQPVPAPIPIDGIIDIAVSGTHAVALKPDGTLLAWGDNGSGQVGDGTAGNIRAAPTPVAQASEIIAVAVGNAHSLALRSDGTVLCWGDNRYGQLGDGTFINRTIPTPTSLSGAKAIAGGWGHSVVLLDDGTVMTFGINALGELGNGVGPSSSTPARVNGLTGVTGIAAGAYHSLAITGQNVVAWGYNSSGQLGDGTTINKVVPVPAANTMGTVRVAAGASFSLALLNSGNVLAWGANRFGQLGDGTLEERHTASSVVGLSEVEFIAAGDTHGFARLRDGQVLAWGNNNSGNLGDGTTIDRSSPVAVLNLETVGSVSAGFQNSFAVAGPTIRLHGYEIRQHPPAILDVYGSNFTPNQVVLVQIFNKDINGGLFFQHTTTTDAIGRFVFNHIIPCNRDLAVRVRDQTSGVVSAVEFINVPCEGGVP